MMSFKLSITYITALLAALTACTTIKKTAAVADENFRPSKVPAPRILVQTPNYTNRLHTVKGKGKALISGPDHSDRATLYFSSNRKKSLITAKNGIGIEGGKLLTDGDSLLIYNRVDGYARKISLRDQPLSDIDNLASVNILQILNTTVDTIRQAKVFENGSLYKLQMASGKQIYVNKKTYRIKQINMPPDSHQPYSQIIYDAYETIDKLSLPRRITIFDAQRSTKVDLLIQSLTVNPTLPTLTIDLPKDIKIYHQ